MIRPVLIGISVFIFLLVCLGGLILSIWESFND